MIIMKIKVIKIIPTFKEHSVVKVKKWRGQKCGFASLIFDFEFILIHIYKEMSGGKEKCLHCKFLLKLFLNVFTRILVPVKPSIGIEGFKNLKIHIHPQNLYSTDMS